MSRIYTRTPHPEKEIPVRKKNIDHLAWQSVVAASEFSVPPRDVDVPTRTIAPGIITFGTPLILSNKTDNPVSVQVRILDEAGTDYMFAPEVHIDAKDAALVPLQGSALVKRDPASGTGDALQVWADTENAVDAFIMCYEREAGQHDDEIGEGVDP